MTKQFIPCILLIFAATLASVTKGQTLFTSTKDVSLTLAGTSTMHDWTMTSNEVNCQADFALGPDGTPTNLSRLSVTLPAESLKSHKEAMDKNAYKALNTDKFKNITFQMLTAKVQATAVQTTGNLTINGVTQKIDLQASCTRLADKTLHCTGKKELKMSDYKVEAPTFIFGTIKTGDAITLTFDVKLAAKPISTN